MFNRRIETEREPLHPSRELTSRIDRIVGNYRESIAKFPLHEDYVAVKIYCSPRPSTISPPDRPITLSERSPEEVGRIVQYGISKALNIPVDQINIMGSRFTESSQLPKGLIRRLGDGR